MFLTMIREIPSDIIFGDMKRAVAGGSLLDLGPLS